MTETTCHRPQRSKDYLFINSCSRHLPNTHLVSPQMANLKWSVGINLDNKRQVYRKTDNINVLFKTVTIFQQSFFFYPQPRTCLLILEMERNIDDRETLIDCLSYMPHRTRTHNLGNVLWLGIELVTFQFIGQHSKQLSHTDHGNKVMFFTIEKSFKIPVPYIPVFIFS